MVCLLTLNTKQNPVLTKDIQTKPGASCLGESPYGNRTFLERKNSIFSCLLSMVVGG